MLEICVLEICVLESNEPRSALCDSEPLMLITLEYLWHLHQNSCLNAMQIKAYLLGFLYIDVELHGAVEMLTRPFKQLW